MSSDCLVSVAVGSRPFVRALCPVLQPVGEVGIGVCALSVRLAVIVGGGAYTSVISSVSGMLSSMCVGSSPSVVWLSVVIVITVCSSFLSAFWGRICSYWPRLVVGLQYRTLK